MLHTIETSATDSEYVIDIDPDLLKLLNDIQPEAEAMREACASGNLTADQSVLKTPWLDQPADKRIGQSPEVSLSGPYDILHSQSLSRRIYATIAPATASLTLSPRSGSVGDVPDSATARNGSRKTRRCKTSGFHFSVKHFLLGGIFTPKLLPTCRADLASNASS